MLKKMHKIASFYFFILVVDFLGGFFKGISFVVGSISAVSRVRS